MADDDEAADVEVSESTASELDTSSSEETDTTKADEAPAGEPADDLGLPPGSGVRLALVLGVIIVVALGGLVGWLGYRAYQSHTAQQQRNLFVQAGRQAAVNLTTISFTEAEPDVQRILDSATGKFYDDFQKRAPAFTEVVKQSQAKSVGTVTEAGLESESGDQGRVLVAVTVKTSNAGAPDQQPRAWRMRLTVQTAGDGAKVSQVEYIP